MIREFDAAFPNATQQLPPEKIRKTTENQGICALWNAIYAEACAMHPQEQGHRIDKYVVSIKELIAADFPEHAAQEASDGLDDVAGYLKLGFNPKYEAFYGTTIKVLSYRLIKQLLELASTKLSAPLCHRSQLYAAALALQQNSFEELSKQQVCTILEQHASCETSREDTVLMLEFTMQQLTQKASCLKFMDQDDGLTN